MLQSLLLALLAAPALAVDPMTESELQGFFAGGGAPAALAELAPSAQAARQRRIEQIRAVVMKHLAAEDAEDMAAVRTTFAPDAAFEDVPRKQVFQGIENILKAYEEKDRVFPPVRRPVIRLIIDETGASAEFDRVDKKTGEVYMRVAARFDVNADGLITREVAYYDLSKVLKLMARHPSWLLRYLKH